VVISKIDARVLTASDKESGARLWKIAVLLIVSLTALPLPAREKDATPYGMGLIVNVPFTEAEVAQVVQDVVQNGIIRGTKEYNKDEYISGATPATSTRVFPEWTEGGKVFYKVRLKALDPRNFKNSSDVGTLVVRYVVQPQGDKNTVLRLDARFVEDFRKVGHPSNGSVESAEYKDIHDHLEAIELMKAQTIEAQKEKQNQSANAQKPAVINETAATVPASVPASTAGAEPPSSGNAPSSMSPSPQTPAQTLEEHVHDLRRQVERLVKAPGAPLQSAPFHTATTLQSLPAGAEVLIVISTPYWFGVETHEGQHGWILRDELEQVP
jgi:polyhydroxyalkanoate synthesis regulator phasin